MPVRKIPRNHLVVTGRLASAKADRMIDFESLLEKDYMLLLEFDDDVEVFEEQPVNIPVPGVPRGYTPDLLVHFKAHLQRHPELVEVKPRSHLEKYAEEYAAKFEAAESYCADRRWTFVKRTEDDIRTSRLENLKFLRGYRNVPSRADDVQRLMSLVEAAGGQCTSEGLLQKIAPEPREQWLPLIWHLIFTKRLLTDLDDMPVDVPVWLPED